MAIRDVIVLKFSVGFSLGGDSTVWMEAVVLNLQSCGFLRFLGGVFISMTNFEENFFKSCDSNSIRSDPKIVQLLIELREELLELVRTFLWKLVSDFT